MKVFLLIVSTFLLSCQSFSVLKPKDSHKILNKAREEAIAGNYEEAISSYGKVINKDSSIDEVIEYSKVMRAGKKIQEALNFLEEYYKTHINAVNNAELNQEIGICYMELGDLKKAEEFFYQTFSIDATNWKAAANLGLINGLQGYYDEARQYFEIALSLSGENYTVLNNYANIERIASNNKKAKKLYQRALAQQLPKKVRESIEKQMNEIK